MFSAEECNEFHGLCHFFRKRNPSELGEAAALVLLLELRRDESLLRWKRGDVV